MSGVFSANAILAYWNGEGEETAPRTIVRGAQAIDRVLAGEARRREIVGELRDQADGFVEGQLRAADGDVTGSFVASLQFDEKDSIVRCLCLHGPAVEPPGPHEGGPPPGAARAALDRYFEHLNAGDFGAAAGCFTVDCLYSHPPYSPGTPRVEFRGQDALREAFEQRGLRTHRPAIIHCVQRGAEAAIEGVVEPDGGSFVSTATLDRDGLVRRYVAFYTSSRIPRLAPGVGG